MKPSLMPINLMNWINENRAYLKPPVGNKLIWEDRNFLAFVVGGPNERQDYHINEGEEFYYQIEGTMVLRIIDEGKPHDIPIHAGEIYLLPPNVPHSPQRPAGTIGLVIEHKRLSSQKDGCRWYCPQCHGVLYEEFFALKNIVKDLPPVFDRFYGDPEHMKCKNCHAVMKRLGK